jgi:toxin ParE1/3/4
VSFSASFNSFAEAELKEAFDHYEKESAGLGEAFLAAVEDAVASLLEHPQAAPVLREPYRKKALFRFPYNIIYRVKVDEVRILAVPHKRRRPFYWLGRT